MLDWLWQRFAEVPDHTALIDGDQGYSYRWFSERIAHWRQVIVAEGLEAKVVALEADYSAESCAALLALIEARAIIVPLSPTLAEERRSSLRQVAEVQKRIVQADDWAIVDQGSCVEHPLTRQLLEGGDPGLVLFSTGTTGAPKGALHNFSRLLEKFKVKRKSLRTIAFLLLDHIGGINTLFYIFSNQGTLVSLRQRDPDSVCQAIARHRVELLPTSPTFLNLLLLSEAHRRHDLSSLRLVTYGTEPMPESTLQRIHRLLPEVELLQTYGLSELGILRSKSRASDSLWVRIGGDGFETKVVDGFLFVRAQSAMLGYLNAPSPFDAEGWFDTQDEVLVDGDYFRILGRRSELINVGGLKVYPAEVESVLLGLDNVVDATVRGQANPITGQMVVARLTLAQEEPLNELRQRVRQACKEVLESYKVPAKIEVSSGPQYGDRFKRMRR